MGKKQILRLLIAVLFLCIGAFAQEELRYFSITEDDLVAGRFVVLPEHLRNAGYFNEDERQTRSETFEDVVVAGIKACKESIDVESFDLGWPDAGYLYLAVLEKHPELFYVLSQVEGYTQGDTCAALTPSYITTNSSTIASQQKEIDKAREQALAMIPSGASDLEKALILHDYLATHCEYDETTKRTNCRNIYGGLVEGCIVCAGYAATYEYLLTYDGVDVTCDYVSSTAMNHAWNMVTISGQKYHVDVTWDDPTPSDGVHRCHVAHDNFLRSNSGIKGTGHTSWDDTTTYTSTSTKYDSYFWQDSERQIPCWDGAAYAFTSSGNLKHYNLSTGSAVKTLLTVNDIWYKWGSTSSYYSGNYSGVVRFGNNLIYSDTKNLHLFDLTDQESKNLSALSYTASGGYLYGIQHESVNLIAPNTAQNPNAAGSYTDIQLYPVTKVTLDKTSLSLTKSSAAVTLKATVTPSNATYPDIRWASSNTSVATVSSSGVVTPVANGTATITATAKDNGTKATCKVTVGSSVVAVTGVSLSQSSASVVVGNTLTLTATVAPSNATDKSVTWSSSNTSVATVSSSGVVTAKAAGSTTITVKTTDGGYTATCNVTVTEAAIAVTGVTLSQSTATLVVGNKLTLVATVSPENATNKNVIWSSSSSTVASVSNGVVTAKKAGTTTITAKTSDGSYKATCKVTVTSGIAVTGVSLSQTTATVKVGKTLTLTATVSPDNATNKSVTWSSSNTSVATVNSSGVITGKAVGTATITVKTASNSKTATCKVTVEDATVAVTSVTVSPSSVTMAKGGTKSLTASVLPATATNKKVTWSTSNASVATVSAGGTVTAIGGGTATITVTTEDGGKTATSSIKVTVPVTSISLNQSSVTLALGKAPLQLTATISPEDATNKNLAWSSSDPAVATVDNGLVTPVARGTATITATTKDGGKTATCDVTVTQPVTGVVLNQTSAELVVGKDTLQLTATASPEDASDKSVTWTSSDPAVATVDNGLVTPVAKGTATITATTTDGGFTATCDVIVDYPANTLFLKKGWNLVAFQMHPTNLNLFDGVVFYQHQGDQYVAVGDFAKNVAYWAFSAEKQAILYDGEDFDESEDPVLTNDWQFVGISDEAAEIDLESIECFEWLNGAFQKVDKNEALEAGHGYLMRKRE